LLIVKELPFYLTAKVVVNQPLSESFAFDFFVSESVVAVDGAHYRELKSYHKSFLTE